MSKQQILTLLGNVDEDKVKVITDLSTEQLLNKLRIYDNRLWEVPDDLDYILTEIVVARFNRLGSEGITSENVEGYSATFDDNYLNNFDNDIAEWAKVNGHLNGRIRFL